MLAPLLDDNLCFIQAVEVFAVQQFVVQLCRDIAAIRPTSSAARRVIPVREITVCSIRDYSKWKSVSYPDTSASSFCFVDRLVPLNTSLAWIDISRGNVSPRYCPYVLYNFDVGAIRKEVSNACEERSGNMRCFDRHEQYHG